MVKYAQRLSLRVRRHFSQGDMRHPFIEAMLIYYFVRAFYLGEHFRQYFNVF